LKESKNAPQPSHSYELAIFSIFSDLLSVIIMGNHLPSSTRRGKFASYKFINFNSIVGCLITSALPATLRIATANQCQRVEIGSVLWNRSDRI
jgi:hypothetical protein